MKRIVTFILVLVSGFTAYTASTYEKQDLTTQTVNVGITDTIIDETQSQTNQYVGLYEWSGSVGTTIVYIDGSPILTQFPTGYDRNTYTITRVLMKTDVAQTYYVYNPSGTKYGTTVGLTTSWKDYAATFGDTGFIQMLQSNTRAGWNVMDFQAKGLSTTRTLYVNVEYTIDYTSVASYDYLINTISVPNTYVENETLNVEIDTILDTGLIPEYVTIDNVAYSSSEFAYSNNVITVPITITDVEDIHNLSVDSIQMNGTLVPLNQSISIANETPKEVESTGSVYLLNGGFDVEVVEQGDSYNVQIEVDTPNTNFYPAEIGLDGYIYQFNEADYPLTADTQYTVKIPFTNIAQYGQLSHHIDYVILQDSTSTGRIKYDVFDNDTLGWNLTLDVGATFVSGIDPLGVTITEQTSFINLSDRVPIEIMIPNYATVATDYEISYVIVNGLKYNVAPEDIVDNKFTIDVITTSDRSYIDSTYNILVDSLAFEKNFGTVESPDIAYQFMSLDYQFDVAVQSPLDMSGLSLNNSYFDKSVYLSNEDLVLNVFIDNPNAYRIDYLKRADGLIYNNLIQVDNDGVSTIELRLPSQDLDYIFDINIIEAGLRMSYNGLSITDQLTINLNESVQVYNYYYDTNVDYDVSNPVYTTNRYYFTGDEIPIFFDIVNPDDVDVFKFLINGKQYVPSTIIGNSYKVMIDPYDFAGEKTIHLQKIFTQKEDIEKEIYINETLDVEIYTSEFALDTSVLTFKLDQALPVYEGDTVPLTVSYHSSLEDLVFRSVTINDVEYLQDDVVADYENNTITVNVVAPSLDNETYTITEMSYIWNDRIGLRTDYNSNFLMSIGSNYDRIQDNILDGQDSWLFDVAIPYWDNTNTVMRILVILFITSPLTVPAAYITYNRVLKLRLADRVDTNIASVNKPRFRINLSKRVKKQKIDKPVRIKKKLKLPKINLPRRKKK